MKNSKNNSTEILASAISFRVSDEECRALAARAKLEQRTLSQMVRVLLRIVMTGDDSLGKGTAVIGTVGHYRL
jgi:hypothetical protein